MAGRTVSMSRALDRLVDLVNAASRVLKEVGGNLVTCFVVRGYRHVLTAQVVEYESH